LETQRGSIEEWEFDAEACCREMQEWIKWEYEQMMMEDISDD
jgi:hypothetical protein